MAGDPFAATARPAGDGRSSKAAGTCGGRRERSHEGEGEGRRKKERAAGFGLAGHRQGPARADGGEAWRGGGGERGAPEWRDGEIRVSGNGERFREPGGALGREARAVGPWAARGGLPVGLAGRGCGRAAGDRWRARSGRGNLLRRRRSVGWRQVAVAGWQRQIRGREALISRREAARR